MKQYSLGILDKLYLEVSLFSFIIIKAFIWVILCLQSSRKVLNFQINQNKEVLSRHVVTTLWNVPLENYKFLIFFETLFLIPCRYTVKNASFFIIVFFSNFFHFLLFWVIHRLFITLTHIHWGSTTCQAPWKTLKIQRPHKADTVLHFRECTA